MTDDELAGYVERVLQAWGQWRRRAWHPASLDYPSQTAEAGAGEGRGSGGGSELRVSGGEPDAVSLVEQLHMPSLEYRAIWRSYVDREPLNAAQAERVCAVKSKLGEVLREAEKARTGQFENYPACPASN